MTVSRARRRRALRWARAGSGSSRACAPLSKLRERDRLVSRWRDRDGRRRADAPSGEFAPLPTDPAFVAMQDAMRAWRPTIAGVRTDAHAIQRDLNLSYSL